MTAEVMRRLPARDPSQDPWRVAGRRGVRLFLASLLVAGVAACTGPGGGPILANPTIAPASPAWTTPPPSRPPDPIPVTFPRDDRPHDRLTEWWYYTGHLTDGSGGRWGFEFVIFRAERGLFPVTWASHLALTDESAGTFRYDQRTEIGPQVDRSPADPAAGWALALTGNSAVPPAAPAVVTGSAPPAPPWTMGGLAGRDRLAADSASAEIGLSLQLAPLRPPTLHDGDGYVDFGPAGGSYYYSRTRLEATGTLRVDGRSVGVQGQAWFDHQWGDFIAVGAGGWDWFAVNLDDGTDLTLSLVRDASGAYPLVYGTLLEPGGAVRNLDRSAFSVETTASWTSPRTGSTYPAGWRTRIPGSDLQVDLRPTVADQELDTRATTGVVYWEGSQVVTAIRAGRRLGGEAYVELTGYAGLAQGPGPTASLGPLPPTR